ncbi:DUF6173 family protein [Yoonia sediminilitoris]|uniref:Uncharacterized protein n=1 Tax=Yoonia sediminilitoris TaxID=1286148 RepID=A0A2T6KIE0_9RHOB|nr:DUF6173 family protein [Yoonia sediminilitoris]PUB15490.1 hypothetical protein C8N45_104110 [Yoonia sediminilitoris]RCW96100.1 hypothetical protein DFP92_104110 [Yoonia sediminilitoris]
MTKDQMTIDTSAEHWENDALPKMREIHTDPDVPGVSADDLPKALGEPVKQKSPAQWAYERIIMYIQNFEKQLDNDHEVGMGLAGGNAGVIRIEGLGYYDPDIVTYYGVNEAGAKTQLIQHVSQLNVTLIASPKHIDQPEPKRIGFRLAEGLERDENVTN